MNSHNVKKLVLAQIGDAWDASNWHGVDLRRSLVKPHKITVRNRAMPSLDCIEEMWLVLEEDPETKDGYKIVYDEKRDVFGLVPGSAESGKMPVLIGYYGNFMDTFFAM